MGNVEPISKESKPRAPGSGGARAGAGRKKGQATTAEFWLAFERRIRAAASKEITREKLLELARADPWRFVERIVIPLIGINKRAAVRLGVSVNEPGGRQTQFVLDFSGEGAANEPGAPLEATAAAGIVAELEQFGRRE